MRCTSGLIALVGNIYCFKRITISDCSKHIFCSTNLYNYFSIFLLNERVGIYRWLAVLVGFVGILIITEPGISELNIYYIFPIIFCLGLSYVAIAIRQLSTTEPVWLISFYFSLSMCITSSFAPPCNGPFKLAIAPVIAP